MNVHLEKEELALSSRQKRLWSHHFLRCESPIEQMFMASWLALFERRETRAREIDESISIIVGTTVDGCETATLGLMEEDPNLDSLDVLIIQPNMGRYRPDFIFWRVSGDPTGGDPIRSGKAIVECDGFDFHDRTREKIARDKARDRAIQAAGFHVLCFTGSEIFNGACKCALEVDKFLAESAYRAAGERHKFPV